MIYSEHTTTQQYWHHVNRFPIHFTLPTLAKRDRVDPSSRASIGESVARQVFLAFNDYRLIDSLVLLCKSKVDVF